MVAYSLVSSSMLASEHNQVGRDESEVESIVSSCPSVVCQHVSVFLGNHEIDFLPVGKQFCKGGNHSQSVLSYWCVGRKKQWCGTGSNAGRYGRHGYDSTPVCCLHGMSESNIQLQTTLLAHLKLTVFYHVA